MFTGLAVFFRNLSKSVRSIHLYFARGSPFANCVVVDAKVLGSFCGVHVFRQFGHSFWDDWQTKLGSIGC